MTILITGQAGYIGSHIARQLVEQDFYGFMGFDNFSTGLNSNNNGTCHVGDITKIEQIEQVFEHHNISTVIHLAALTSVPESQEKRDLYFETNFEGTKNLLEIMKKYDCKNLIFSSTASVYKATNSPIKETDVLQPLNNYAITKHLAEQEISRCDWLNYIIFRYFNVIGYENWFDKSNEIQKTNIVPALIRAKDYKCMFNIYGNGYPRTKEEDELKPGDHTAIRDYIDVRDIARAHLMAYNYIHDGCKEIFNLGTKNGSSVFEIIKAFEKANGTKIPYEIKPPRKGDPASLIANNTKARELLKWDIQYSLEESLKVI